MAVYVIDRRGKPLRVKIDPGSKASGLALVRDSQEIDIATGEVTTTAHAKAPLHDATAVNATRNALAMALIDTSLPIEFASGGQTGDLVRADGYGYQQIA